MANFQVKLAGEWKDYSKDEDKILKRAFLAGFPNAKFSYRKNKYEVNFKKMTQKNATTGKEREIRAPRRLKPPSVPVCVAGPTTCIKVPPGSQGSTISVPHPKDKTQLIQVNVPKAAKDGQAMLVPIPPLETAPLATAPGSAAAATAAAPPAVAGERKGSSTGAKVATGAAVVGLAVGGALLGEHIAEEGLLEDLGDGLEGAGEAIVDGADAAAEWTEDAAETTGDFIMDLF
jgi:hypothetical protein